MEFFKVLKTSEGSMTFLITGFTSVSFTNLSTGKTITVPRAGDRPLLVGFIGRERSAVVAQYAVTVVEMPAVPARTAARSVGWRA